MRPHPRRARTDPRSPRAWGTSDRNGMVGQQENLVWQHEWAGLKLINTRVLVFPDEYDQPNRQLGAIIIPPDPPPVYNARPEQYFIDEYASILFEQDTPNNSTSFVAGTWNGVGIDGEANATDNTVCVALELDQYNNTGILGPQPAPSPFPPKASAYVFAFNNPTSTMYLPLLLGGI